MANLRETANTYPSGIYQLEQNDSVLGGAGGISNRQAQQLANRTRYLNDKATAAEAKNGEQDAALTGLSTRVAAVEAGQADGGTQVNEYWRR